jgi:hypothetical protein
MKQTKSERKGRKDFAKGAKEKSMDSLVSLACFAQLS